MTNVQKLTKAIEFINQSNFSTKLDRGFVIEDGVPYKIITYFYDYHSGKLDVTDKQLVTEEQAATYLGWSSIRDTINEILLASEAAIAKQHRLAKFYETEEI